VFGHRKRKGAIRFANPTAPAKALILIKTDAHTLEDFHSGVHQQKVKPRPYCYAAGALLSHYPLDSQP
jgi:hypothetical protein